LVFVTRYLRPLIDACPDQTGFSQAGLIEGFGRVIQLIDNDPAYVHAASGSPFIRAGIERIIRRCRRQSLI
jgi:hypothetical protein